jgi:tetratricopeptide (TPR) repeat protein
LRSVLNVERFKNKARKLEQKDQPGKAIEVYLQILKELDGTPELDGELGLYNKVGDLYLKSGNVNGAVEMYERAVGRYIDSGYPNNAIALCNKILRSAPGRHHMYLTLGQLMHQRGFVAEAKKNLVEYAQRMSDAGRLDEAFGALKQFADISPGNEDIRLMLAEQLKATARDEEAREQIDKLMLGSTESARRASEILERVRAVDPEYDVEAGHSAKGKGKSEDLIFIPLDDEAAAQEEAKANVEPLDIEQSAIVDDTEPLETTVAALEGLESESSFDPTTAGGVAPLEIEPTSLSEDEATEEAPAEEDLSFLSVEGDSAPDDEDSDLDVPELDLSEPGMEEETSDDGLVILNAGENLRAGVSSTGELPLLDVHSSLEPQPVDVVSTEVDPVTALEARVEEDPDDPQLRRKFAEALIESGDRRRGLDELDIALHRFEVIQDWSRASAVAEEILRLEPSSIAHYQKRVEFAYRLNEKSQLVRAYLDLANAFFRSGSLDRAQAVYQRVLEHDPSITEARDALASLTPEEPEPTPAVASGRATVPRRSGGYVDLGEFILGDDDDRDTRMKVEQEAPSGDEQKDFADMLQQFKRGIEENLDEEDSQAHYDLGVAFKEMGLLDEAIGEFQKSLRAPETRLQSAEMLGLCFIEKGQYEVAATVLRRAVDSDPSSDQDKVGVLYWLARCEEEKARPKEALSYYRRVFAVDIHFKDVEKRVESLVQSVEG